MQSLVVVVVSNTTASHVLDRECVCPIGLLAMYWVPFVTVVGACGWGNGTLFHT